MTLPAFLVYAQVAGATSGTYERNHPRYRVCMVAKFCFLVIGHLAVECLRLGILVVTMYLLFIYIRN